MSRFWGNIFAERRSLIWLTTSSLKKRTASRQSKNKMKIDEVINRNSPRISNVVGRLAIFANVLNIDGTKSSKSFGHSGSFHITRLLFEVPRLARARPNAKCLAKRSSSVRRQSQSNKCAFWFSSDQSGKLNASSVTFVLGCCWHSRSSFAIRSEWLQPREP